VSEVDVLRFLDNRPTCLSGMMNDDGELMPEADFVFIIVYYTAKGLKILKISKKKKLIFTKI
jgi:hypothetical protein